MSIDATNLFNGISVYIQEEDITVKVSSGLRGPVGFEYIGTYSAGVTYYHTNVVTYNNALYIGLVAIDGMTGITGVLPTNTTYWARLLDSTGPFAAIASQAEAEAGTDNTKGMTPLRTNQAIAALETSHINIKPTALATKTTDYTITATDYTILVDATTTDTTITLPAVSTVQTNEFHVKKVDSSTNTVIIDGNASETIDGELTFILTSQYENLTIQSDGSNWHIL